MVDSQPINIVRIHGTFSPKPEWFDKTSLLSKTLLAHFPNAQLLPFNWSGHNSHSARINAGSRLSEYLRDLRTDDPSRPCFVVTHSHGGMVLLYALSQKSTQESIDGCVFLGTPFLMTRRRSLGAYIDNLSFQLTWLSLSILPIVLLVLWFGISINGLIGSIVVVFMAIYFSAESWFERNITNRISRALLRTLEKRQEVFLKYVTPASLNLPALICYAPYDEARGWLSLLNSVTGSTFTVTANVVEFLTNWPLFIFMLVIAFAIDWLVGERNAFAIVGIFPSFVLVFVGMLFILVLSVVMPVMSALLRGHLAGFGWEGLLGYSLVEVRPSYYPMTDPEANVLLLRSETTQSGYRGLQHSKFYVDSSLVDSLVAWIQGRLSETTTPSLAAVPHIEDATIVPSDKNTIQNRTFLFAFGLVVLCMLLSFLSMFHHFRDVSFELSDVRIVGQREIVSMRGYLLDSEERRGMVFSIDRPPPGQVLYLVGHYRTDSVRTLVDVDLLYDKSESDRALQQLNSDLYSKSIHFSICLNPHPDRPPTNLYASYPFFNRREQSFSRKVDFGADGPAAGCVIIRNKGKKTQSFVDVNLSLVYLKDESRPDGLLEHINR